LALHFFIAFYRDHRLLRGQPRTLISVITWMTQHMLCVGLPIAIVVRRSSN
jgi:hypothetical protein